MREYFIKYIKVVQKSCSGMTEEKKSAIIKARSAQSAWVKIGIEESEFNGLRLEDIKRI